MPDTPNAFHIDHLLTTLRLSHFQCGTSTLGTNLAKSYYTSIRIQPCALLTQITDGPVQISIERETFVVEPGQALYIPANLPYTLQLIDRPTVSHWLNFNFTVFEHFPLLDLLEAPYVTSVSIGNDVGKLQAGIHGLVHSGRTDLSELLHTAGQVKQRMYVVLELIMSFSRYKSGGFEKISKLQRFRSVLDYIENHLHEKIKISQLAGLMFVSISHFYKDFQEAFDVSPLQYIQSQRYKKAQALLATSDLPIHEIANRVGYEQPFPFIRFFKSLYGASPGHYRKMMLERFN
ncbi:MAG: transcriptional regulator [Paenibacillus sp.]|jgi:AraC-like DNA-binding protein|nr:transcriptional regulator [Paenibacillus sp.]